MSDDGTIALFQTGRQRPTLSHGTSFALRQPGDDKGVWSIKTAKISSGGETRKFGPAKISRYMVYSKQEMDTASCTTSDRKIFVWKRKVETDMVGRGGGRGRGRKGREVHMHGMKERQKEEKEEERKGRME